MASDDWRTSGHAPGTPEPPPPHGATPEAAAAAQRRAQVEAEARARRDADHEHDHDPSGDSEPGMSGGARDSFDPIGGGDTPRGGYRRSGDDMAGMSGRMGGAMGGDSLPGSTHQDSLAGPTGSNSPGATGFGTTGGSRAGADAGTSGGFGTGTGSGTGSGTSGAAFSADESPGADTSDSTASDATGAAGATGGSRGFDRATRAFTDAESREQFKREARARAEAARIEAQRQASTWWRDFTRAAVFLTRIPLQIAPDNALRPLASATRGFPVVGLVVGVIGALAFLLASELALPQLASALTAVAATALVTGGIHEDGLADTVDGFMAARDRDETLTIMHDSRIGAFGALALIIMLGLKVSGIETLEPAAGAAALVAAEVASRTVLPGVMLWLPAARSDGLGFEAGQPPREDVVLQGMLGGVLVLLMIGVVAGIVAIVVACAVAALLARLSQARIGGHTGDVLGAIQQAVSTAVLLTAAAVV